MSPRDTFLLATAITFIVVTLLGVYNVPYDPEVRRRLRRLRDDRELKMWRRRDD